MKGFRLVCFDNHERESCFMSIKSADRIVFLVAYRIKVNLGPGTVFLPTAQLIERIVAVQLPEVRGEIQKKRIGYFVSIVC
jgi:hypothetical protein